MTNCIFCEPNRNTIFAKTLFENDHSFVVLDKFPASPGHLLIISKQHYEHWFVAPKAVQESIHELVIQAQQWLLQHHKPDGFNIGANCGIAAGQTVLHLHYHVIPRYNGDHPNPAGGVRHAVYGKGYY